MSFNWQLPLSTAASLISTANKERALRRAQNEIRAGQQEGAVEQQRADARVNEEIAARRASNPDELRRESLGQYVTALQQQRGQGAASVPPNLGGERFRDSMSAQPGQVAGYGNRVADIMTRIDTPLRQRTLEGESNMRAGGDLGRAADRANTWRYLAQLRAARQRPNPYVDAAAQLAQNIAMFYDPKEPPRDSGMAPGDETLPPGYMPPGWDDLNPPGYTPPAPDSPYLPPGWMPPGWRGLTPRRG
jgi:hypothetical protein